jgi:hypothetical protein
MRLGISHETLAHYVEVGKVPSPEVITLGKGQRAVHAWTEAEVEHVRKLLPKIANGRKTRYQKLKNQPKPQPRAAALPKKRGTKKKK